MPHHVCVACSTQFAETARPPAACPICEDGRQFVPTEGQRWTTLEALRDGHRNRLGPQGGLTGIETEPAFGIGQRALLVPFGGTNVLWDCVALLDEATAGEIERRGGLAAIAISHPHYYSTMVAWARRFDCPIHLHADDAAWVMRADPAVHHWTGETLALGHGLTLIRTGGHFPGQTVLHRETADGGGELLCGDALLTVADRHHVTALWSYPNRVPLHADAVLGIADALAPFSFATLQDAFWDGFRHDAEAVVHRSLRRLLTAVEAGPAETGPNAGLRLRSAAPVMSTTDVGAWLAHYGALGFTVVAHDAGYGFASLGPVELHVSRDPEHDPARTAGCAYLHVEDADAVHAAWSTVPGGRDVAPVDTDYGLREGAHVDPDGNLLRYGSPMG